MARFSAPTLLVTAFYFLVWATQVSTPFHSDSSLRTIKIIPQVFPILTISAPPPTHSPYIGVNRRGTATIRTWTSKIVRSANQVRGYLSVGSLASPYFLQINRYVHQVTNMLGRLTPDSLVGLVELPTTGKLPVPPLVWALVEKTPVALLPPPPPPTRTFPTYIPPTPISGPWNPPTPTTGHARSKCAELAIKIDSNTGFQRMVFIGSFFVLIAASFIRSFTTALASVKCVEHRSTANGRTISRDDTIRSVVPPKTESSTAQATQKSIAKPTLKNQRTRRDPLLATLSTPNLEPVDGETSSQTLDLVLWRTPTLMPHNAPLVPSPPIRMLSLTRPVTSRSQLGVTLRQPIRLDDIPGHVGPVLLLPQAPIPCRVPLLIGWHDVTTEERFEVTPPLYAAPTSIKPPAILHHRIPTAPNTLLHLVPTRVEESGLPRSRTTVDRRAPLLIGWNPIQRGPVAQHPEIIYPSSTHKTRRPLPTLVAYTPIVIRPPRVFPRWDPQFLFSNNVPRPVSFQRPHTPADSFPGRKAAGWIQPLLIEWGSKQKADDLLSPTPVQSVAEPSSSATPRLINSPYTTSTVRHPPLPHSLNAPSSARTISISNLDHTAGESTVCLSAKGHTPPAAGSGNENKINPHLPELLTATSTSSIQPDPPPPSKAPLHIPPSFYRYGNIRLEDLDGHPSEERQNILHREIKIAEDRYRQEKPRRDRARLNSKWTRSEMKRKGVRPPKRQKSKEEIEEEGEMERVMKARKRGEEEVFRGRGGPPPPTPEWLLSWVGTIKGNCLLGSGNTKIKGEGEKRVKSVRWADEVGRSLVEWEN